jgi:DNA-binding NtrC family response regulator
MKEKILIVDDNPADLFTFRKWVELWGFEPLEAKNATEGEKIATEEIFSAAILDFKLPDFNGIELFRRINKLKPGLPVILITGAHKPELTIQAMSEGLYHYMSKPADMEELRIHIERAINLKRMKNDYMRIKASKGEEWFIGSSRGMLEVFRSIGLFANNENPVLIYGETGTGKELVARALHQYSDRRDEKFIPLHLSALAPNLIESELFGHEKGAFTGAFRRHKGRFEVAGKGSLFIDELADIPQDTQVKFLRILEYGDFTPVGGEEALSNQAKLIVATNIEPKQLMNNKRLREDLYFRLNVCRINIPPLRERKDDIPELVNHFIARENVFCKKDIIGISNDVLEEWTEFKWPGNVRELQNTIRRAVAFTRDSLITETFLDQPLAGKPATVLYAGESLPDVKEEVARFERKTIMKALKQASGNISQAAQLIGLTRREMERRLEKYNIDSR